MMWQGAMGGSDSTYACVRPAYCNRVVRCGMVCTINRNQPSNTILSLEIIFVYINLTKLPLCHHPARANIATVKLCGGAVNEWVDTQLPFFGLMCSVSLAGLASSRSGEDN